MPPLAHGATILASSLGVAFVLSLLLTPLVRKAAQRFSAPTETRADPPAMGGLAVVVAMFVAHLLFAPSLPLGFLVVVAEVALIGFVDDVRPLSPVLKTVLLALAAMHGWVLGLRFDLLPGVLDGGLTTLWLVWMAHATNVLDMEDGLLSSIGIVACAGLFAVGWVGGLPDLLLPAVGLAGALGGFLVYNWHPARIYPGDTGSLFVGFYLGGLAMVCVGGLSGPSRVVSPILILGMPMFEAIFLIVVRTAKGRVPWRPSIDHPAHRLCASGMGVRGAVVLLCAVGALLSLGATGTIYLSAFSIWVLGGGCVLAMIGLGIVLGRVDVEGDGIDGRPLSLLSKNWLVTRLTHGAMAAERDVVHGRLLDIGCGRRPYLSLFEERVTDYIGLEREPGRYSDLPPEVKGDGKALPFVSDSFDTVISNQVLEHVPEPAYAVVEMARVMRPGARAVITAPLIWGIHEEPHDYFRFTPYGLTYVAERAGLIVERVCPLGGYWVTTGARFCYYLEHFARGPVRPIVALLWMVVQSVSVWLDGLHRVEGDAWNHLMVARKPED